MDYNARIRWQEGMMLTKELFSQIEADLSARQQIAIHTAIGAGRCGILPDTPLHTEGLFVRRVYEMTGLQCTAVLPSGRILSVDADLKLPINIESDEDADYYVALGYGSEKHEYERDGVPYVTPQVKLSLLTLEEIEQEDVLPLKHFYIREGALNVDSDYIPPTLVLATDQRYNTHIRAIAEKITAIATHQNMDKGDCKRTLLHYAFMLRSYDQQHSTSDLIELLQEVAQVIDFYLVEELGATIGELPEQVREKKEDNRRTPKVIDIVPFLRWMEEYLNSQMLIMEKVIIEKPEIDVEAIKRDIREALYQDLYEALRQKLQDDLRQQLTAELPEPIIEQVKAFLEANIHPLLRTELHDDLRGPLYNDLYDSLMAALNEMLSNFEFKQVDSFIPMI